MEMLTTYIIPEITILCLILGFIVKKWVADVDNKWIPTIVAVVGIAAACLMNLGNISIGVIVGGGVSGLASTGLHQMFTQWIDNGGQ